MRSKTIFDYTLGQKIEIIKKMEISKEIFSKSKKDISLTFLNYLTEIDLKKLSYSEIYKYFLSNTSLEEQEVLLEKRLDEESFFLYLFHNKIGLKQLPIDILNEYFFEAIEDIKEIENEIKDLIIKKNKFSKQNSEPALILRSVS